MKPVLLAGLAWILAASPAVGQANIQNATLQERPAGELSRTFGQLAHEVGPLWVGYAVPAHSPDWNACCWNGSPRGREDCGRCALEDERGESTTITTSGARTVQLERKASVLILYRIEQGQVHKIRPLSDSCEIDAGGRTVVWLTGVNPAASVALLRTLVQSPAARGQQEASRHLTSEALLAMTAHGAPEAVTTLLELAREDSSSRVRSDALFWVAQRAGEKAAATITDAIANDPDTKVKERAVFALSQLPEHEGVPKLIDVARTNRNPRVRRQAVFWLGQSRDPRALKFFEEILLK